MLDNFLNQTCNITNIELWAMSWWEQTKVEVVIKENVKCKMYKKKAILWNNISETDNKAKYECLLEPITTLIKEWYKLKISDKDIWEIGTFRVLNLGLPKRRRNWIIDHIPLTIEKWQ